jgi:tRNA dimethylallyltransferase
MMKNTEKKPHIVAVVGPTAVGKTALAIELAKHLNGEIISCDSMQVYRGMDIGTAKATVEERALVPHHLIDIKNPDEDFSCADFAVLANEAVKDILSRGKTPIFCGGTGLYLDSVIEIPSWTDTKRDENYRAEMEKYALENGNSALHDLLRKVDSESADAIHENNVKRVIRALEIFHTTGKKKSELDALSKTVEKPFCTTVFYLTFKDREALYSRIDTRVDMMIENGLVAECQALFDGGYLENGSTASDAIGYKELLPYIKGEDTLENCINELKLSTRHYAKRQGTWFRKKKDYHTVFVDEVNPLAFAIEVLKNEF